MKKLESTYDNVGGISSIYAIPAALLDHVSYNAASNMRTFTLSSNDGVIQIDGHRAGDFSEESTISDEGTEYNVQISGKIFTTSKDRESIIDELSNGSWYVLHRDCNGQMRLSGTPDIPLLFTYNENTGQHGSSSMLTYRFSAIEARQSLRIDVSPL